LSQEQLLTTEDIKKVPHEANCQPPKHKDTRNKMTQAIPISEELDQVASAVVDSAYTVHRASGPGLLESVYETCLQHELTKRGYRVQTQVQLPVEYDGLKLEMGLRLDMLVNGSLIVEIKATEALIDVHKAQLLTYLKLTGHRRISNKLQRTHDQVWD
jgi:GxxExxY protein